VRAAGWIASLVAVLAGLIVLGGTTAGWVVDSATREVGGLDVPQVATVSGAELQPALVVVGLALLLSGAPLGVTTGVVRRIFGVVVMVTAVAGAGWAVVGAVRAAELPGTLQPSVWLTAVGTVVGFFAGLLAMSRPQRRASLPDRFDIDAPPLDEDRELDEWDLAVDDREDGRDVEGNGQEAKGT
jgi:hypothetical protein